MFNWTDAEDEIFDWVVTSSSLSESNVVWSHYNMPRLTGQFVTLFLDGPTTIGLDYIQYSTDLGQPLGEEIELKVTGTRSITARITCFGGDQTGSSGALALASKIMAGVRLPSINTALHGAGLYPYGTPTIQNIPEIVGANFEPRTVLEQTFYLVDDISERTGYIATVSGSGTVSGTVNSDQSTFDFLVTT